MAPATKAPDTTRTARSPVPATQVRLVLCRHSCRMPTPTCATLVIATRAGVVLVSTNVLVPRVPRAMPDLDEHCPLVRLQFAMDIKSRRSERQRGAEVQASLLTPVGSLRSNPRLEGVAFLATQVTERRQLPPCPSSCHLFFTPPS